MKSVGLVTYSDSPNLSEGDNLLIGPLKQQGYIAQPASWDDYNVEWDKFDLIILRSCWNYHYKINDFLQWLKNLEKKKIKTWNPLSIIRWNYNKEYIFDLQKKHINIVPTILVKKETNCSLENICKKNNWNELVIKPTIGASAKGVFNVKKKEIKRMQKKFDKQIEGSDLLIQPLVEEIISCGEYSFIFLGNNFSHAVMKKPKQGEFRSNYAFGGSESLIKPDNYLLSQVKTIFEKIDKPLLYARIDGVNIRNKFFLMELELIEPYLFFDQYPQSSYMFAKSLKKLENLHPSGV